MYEYHNGSGIKYFNSSLKSYTTIFFILEKLDWIGLSMRYILLIIFCSSKTRHISLSDCEVDGKEVIIF